GELPDLRKVLVFAHLIREALAVDLGEEGAFRQLLTGASGARLRIDHEGRRLDRAGLEQGNERHENRSCIAPGVCDQFGLFRTAERNKPVLSLGKQALLGVLEAVPLRITRGLQAKGAREIDHLDAGLEKLRRKLERSLGRGRKKHRLKGG